MTREEELWAAIIAALQGDNVDVPVPAWRREEFLVGILGAIKGVEGASVPVPVWREEQYLKALFDELDGKSCLQAKPCTPSASSQEVKPDSGYYGLSKVTVAGDADLVAGNIKKDVEIFGVTGTYEGSGGGASKPIKDVIFIDYDGSIVESYTANEFASLSSLPANPTHDGLTAQGWNWTLAEAKAQVASSGSCIIGQMYVTTSGDTEIDVELFPPRLSPGISLAVDGTVEIDWGDGTSKDTVTQHSLSSSIVTYHNYVTGGSFTIKVHTVSGSYKLYGNSDSFFTSAGTSTLYSCCVKAVRLGNIAGIARYTFKNCCNVSYITMPNSIASIGSSTYGDANYFNNCFNLPCIIIPNSVTSLGEQAFLNCYSARFVSIPNTIQNLPKGTFNGLRCNMVTIPEGVTSIGTTSFNNWSGISSITIPSTVTSIGANGLNMIGLGEIHFKGSTPPALDQSSFGTNNALPTDCKIYVPTGKLSDYTSAQYYPSSSTYTYIEE